MRHPAGWLNKIKVAGRNTGLMLTKTRIVQAAIKRGR